ncbi:HEAT repeat domain-containing protein [Catellatospora vulcania]|uniref:HEAT repeat domain-containing protein n=1 Tax=Catellatospora vulcania TaxID=1460450 RepID=UPI0018AFA52E|nr:HEAT repeat domain-containing protein [Catellatospora vulcania]
MGTAKARRIAARAHCGQLLAAGVLFTDHLREIAQLVGEHSGDEIAVQAAWLHAVPATGCTDTELLTRGVAPAVVRLVALLQEDFDERAYTRRLLADPRAALVRHAVLSARLPHLANPYARERWRAQHRALADRLGRAAPPTPANLSTTPPPAGGHWGPFARWAKAEPDLAQLPPLLDAYHDTRADPERRHCCHNTVKAAIHTVVTKRADATDEHVVALADRWWNSDDSWEQDVAVRARAAARDPAHRPALLARALDGAPWPAASAIRALTGPGDAAEIAVLREIVERRERIWRWTRRTAVARLLAIDHDDARAVLDDRPLDPVDPPWHDDRSWLHRYRAAVIPQLIGLVDEPGWWFEAPWALGELRAVEAVPALCRYVLAHSAAHPRSCAVQPHVDALGRIGSAEAVPALLTLISHNSPEVRDLALRALDRIGDPRVVDAAVAACDDLHPDVRDRAARVLARHGDVRAVPALIRLCDTVHAPAAAEALARIGDPLAGDTLWRLFRSAPDRRTRHAAGRGLARIGQRGHCGYTPDLRTQRAYLWLLGHQPGWRPHHQLTEALAHGDALMRAAAIAALARLGERGEAALIAPLLDDPAHGVRAAAATALGRFGGVGTRERLDAHRSDPHGAVRSAVLAALRRLADGGGDAIEP